MNPSPPETEIPQAEDRALRIVLLTARRAEYMSALETTGNFSKKLTQNHPYYALNSERYRLRVSHLGVGPKQAKKTLGKISSILKGDLLILAGTAGSLRKDIEKGTLFIPTAIAHTSDKDWYYPDTELLHWLAGVLTENHKPGKLRMGPMVTSPRPVLKTEQRDYLSEMTGAMAVDMESALAVEKFRQSDDEEGQWLSLRLISDGPGDSDEKNVENKQKQATKWLNEHLQTLLKNFN